MIKALDYLRRLFVEAKTKLTTYLALLTATAIELPLAVSQESLNALHLSAAMLQNIAAFFAIMTIWSRVRRALKAPPV